MSRHTGIVSVVLAFALAGFAGQAQSNTIMIDDFNSGALFVSIPDGAPGPASGGVACTGCVGGARYVSVVRTNASDDAVAAEVDPFSFGSGWFLYSNEIGVDSQATVMWDGGTDAVNDHGLSLDFTGGTGVFALELESDVTVSYTFTLYSDGGTKSSMATLTLSEAAGDGDLTNGGVVKLLTGASFVGDVDFSNVQSIVMAINGRPSFDTAIRFIEYRVPEPGSLALLALGLIGVGAARRRGTHQGS